MILHVCTPVHVKTGAKIKSRRPTLFLDKEGSRVTEEARHVYSTRLFIQHLYTKESRACQQKQR